MKIAVLLSGGVDSSVTLHLLQQQGYQIEAFYLKVWLEDELAFLGDCPWETDLGYARSICRQAGVKLHVISLQADYLEKVVSYTLAELKRGHTPSPDIFCNQQIKFGSFFSAIDDSYTFVASGHYARIEQRNGQRVLLKGVDPVKDQTYFLSHLLPHQLQRALFPIGSYRKSEVRELAEKLSLPNQSRRDSQGICFLGKIKYNEFIRAHLGSQSGDIIDETTGKKLGEHNGYWFHTIGQRSGLDLPGGPWYVNRKNIDENIIYVRHRNYYTDSLRQEFVVSTPHLLYEQALPEKMTLKIRHGATVHPASITSSDDQQTHLRLDEPIVGIAPGQFAVFYKEDMCLGGAMIIE